MPDEAALQAMFEAKARAELEAADALLPGAEAVHWSGDVLARVALLKGHPGEEDRRTGQALAGSDGEAARKALAALGLDGESVFATVTRFEGDEASVTERLALQLEAVDPAIVIALDGDAAADLARVIGMGSLGPGEPTGWMGRTVLALSGLEASLADEALKQVVWQELKTLSAAQ